MNQPNLANNDVYILMFSQYPDVVNVNQMCKMLGGISKKLAYQMLNEKQISSVRVGREFKIAKVDLIDFMLQRENA